MERTRQGREIASRILVAARVKVTAPLLAGTQQLVSWLEQTARENAWDELADPLRDALLVLNRLSRRSSEEEFAQAHLQLQKQWNKLSETIEMHRLQEPVGEVTFNRARVSRYQTNTVAPASSLGSSVLAYLVKSSGKHFLLPAQGVRIEERRPQGNPTLRLEKLLGMPASSSDGVGAFFRILGTEIVLEVDEIIDSRGVHRPKGAPPSASIFNCEPLVDSKLKDRGVSGSVTLSSGVRALVLDLKVWLNGISVQKSDQGVQLFGRHDTFLFRISGRRFAIPAGVVVGSGRIESRSWLARSVKDSKGNLYPIRDLKNAIGLLGEAGNVYLLIQIGNQVQAWAVDGIEGVRTLEPAQIQKTVPFHGSNQNPFLKDAFFLKEEALGPHPKAIYLIETKLLAPLARAIDRGRFRTLPKL